MAHRSHTFHPLSSHVTLHKISFLSLIILLFMLILWTIISVCWFLTSATTTLEYNKKIEDERARYEEELLALSTQAEELKGNDKNLEQMVQVLITRAKALQARQVLLSSLTERLHYNLTASFPSSTHALSGPVHMNDLEPKNEEPLHHLAHEDEEGEDFEGPTHQKPMPLAEGAKTVPSPQSPRAFYNKMPKQSWPTPTSSPSYPRRDIAENLQGKSLKDQISALMELTQHIDQHYTKSLHHVVQTTQKTSTRLQSVLSFLGLRDQAILRNQNIKIDSAGIGGPFVPLSSRVLRSDDTFSNVIRSLKKSIEDTLYLTKILHYVPIASPKPGPVSLTSSFGVRFDPFTRGMAMHTGVDMRMAHGSPVYATAAGKVSMAHHFGGYGLLVEIDHGYGFHTRYAHLSRIHVAAGQRIRRGTLIGAAGSTGRSTGPHLHYEVRMNGRPTNPVRFLKALAQTRP